MDEDEGGRIIGFIAFDEKMAIAITTALFKQYREYWKLEEYGA